jgi:hypothetical protein
MGQPDSRPAPLSFRRDGWTIPRQLAFLDLLARTRSVTAAARAAGMSRESAYRLRRRPSAALFAAAWDRALKRRTPRSSEGHKGVNFPSWRKSLGNGGFGGLSMEGHKVEDPLFSLIPRSPS